MTPDLQNKIILITGASRGIGRAVAIAAAKAGAEIIMTGRTMGVLEESDDAIKAAGGIDLQILGVGNNGHIGFKTFFYLFAFEHMNNVIKKIGVIVSEFFKYILSSFLK